MFGAPDWNAFQPAPPPLEPLPQTTDHHAYRAPPGSGPVSEVGDGDYGVQSCPVHYSPTVMHHHAMMKHPMHPPSPPAAPVRQMQGHRGPPIQLSLNIQYGHRNSAGPYSGYTHSSTTSPVTSDIAEQMNQFSMAQHGSPMKAMMGGMDPVASSAAMYHHGHMYSRSMEHLLINMCIRIRTMFDALHKSQPQQQHHTDHQWPDWTNADPFHTDTRNSGGVAYGGDHAGVGSDAASLDPTIGHTPGVGAMTSERRCFFLDAKPRHPLVGTTLASFKIAISSIPVTISRISGSALYLACLGRVSAPPPPLRKEQMTEKQIPRFSHSLSLATISISRP